MKISKNTINTLKNFASINSNLVFKPGNTVRTISESKTIMSSAQLEESFPVEFGIYDLNEFLSVYSLFEDPELTFEDKTVLIHEGSQQIRYFFSNTEILTQPSKDIIMPESEFKITVTATALDKIRRAASVLGHSEISIDGEDGKVSAVVFDSKDATSNTYKVDLDDNNDCKNEFNFVFNIANLKMIQGDYDLSISSKLISNWSNSNQPIEYFIALEKSSTFRV